MSANMSLTLVRIRVSKDALMTRNEYQARLINHNLATSTEESRDMLPGVRPVTDAVRVALSYRMRNWQRWEQDGKTCKAIVASPKGGDFAPEIHVQERDTEHVRYTSRVAKIMLTGNDADGYTPIYEEGSDHARYRNIMADLDVPTLADFGQSNLFEQDMRRLIDGMLEGHVLKFWPGTYACLSEDDTQLLGRIQSLFSILAAGEVRIRPLVLDTGEANREAIAQELADENLTPAFNDIATRCQKPGPNLELLEAEYMALYERRENAERLLGVAVPCDDAQEAAEAALSEAFEKAAA